MFIHEIEEINKKVEKFVKDDLKIFSTSSFQTNSVVLLHIISQIEYDIPVYFLNTGYHFPETLLFKSDIKSLLDIKVVDIFSDIPKHQQRDSNGQLMYTSNPDYCCYMNKVNPLEGIKNRYDLWMSGVRASQSPNRAEKKVVEIDDDGLVRFHPILEWSNKKVYQYIDYFNLPRHPLENEGYTSIGCQPCTQKMTLGNQGDVELRSGRWVGLGKTECGLHT